MNSIFFKYFRMTSLLILGSILALGIGFVTLIQSYLTRDRLNQLHSHAVSLKSYAERTFPRSNSPLEWSYFQNTINLVSHISSTHIVLCYVDGSYFFSSNSQTETSGRFDRGILDTVIKNYNNSVRSVFIGTLNGYYLADQRTEAIPVSSDGDNSIFAVFFISMPYNSNQPLLLAFVRSFLYVSLLVVFIAAVSAYIMSRRMNRPLRKMRAAAASFSLGDFSQRVLVEPSHNDEISDLAIAFNGMADSLEKAELLRRGFIANVSHEMRTPMTNILGYIDGIVDGTLPADRRNQYLTIIRDEILRLSRLVKRMLDIARLQSGEFEVHVQPTDLSELASRVLIAFEPKILAKKLEVEADFEDEAWCLADGDAITQVCYNLIDNAIKFSYEGAALSLSVQTRGGKVIFTVSNGGPDIPPDDLPYIFDRFHKADHSRARDPGGLGLGLYLVKTIVNGHHENVTAESRNGVTTFRFSLAAYKRAKSE